MGRKIHTNKKKVKELAGKIGEVYKKALADPNHTIDRDELVKAIECAMISKDKSESNPNSKDRKTLMFDVVVDEDLDEHTRLVWITLPTPDVKYKGNNKYEDWEDYMKDNLDWDKNAGDFKDTKKLEELTEFILFGCGR